MIWQNCPLWILTLLAISKDEDMRVRIHNVGCNVFSSLSFTFFLLNFWIWTDIIFIKICFFIFVFSLLLFPVFVYLFWILLEEFEHVSNSVPLFQTIFIIDLRKGTFWQVKCRNGVLEYYFLLFWLIDLNQHFFFACLTVNCIFLAQVILCVKGLLDSY